MFWRFGVPVSESICMPGASSVADTVLRAGDIAEKKMERALALKELGGGSQ